MCANGAPYTGRSEWMLFMDLVLTLPCITLFLVQQVLATRLVEGDGTLCTKSIALHVPKILFVPK